MLLQLFEVCRAQDAGCVNMMVKHEERELVALAISRLLATVDSSEPGASLPRCRVQYLPSLSAFHSTGSSWFLYTVSLVDHSSHQLYT